MSRPPQSPEPQRKSGDPWHAGSYPQNGVGMNGLVRSLLDQWQGKNNLLQ